MMKISVPGLSSLNTTGMLNPSYFTLGSNSCSQPDSFHTQMSTLPPIKELINELACFLDIPTIFANPVTVVPETQSGSSRLPTTRQCVFLWNTNLTDLPEAALSCKSPTAKTVHEIGLSLIAHHNQEQPNCAYFNATTLQSRRLFAEQIHPAAKPRASQQLTACKGSVWNQICLKSLTQSTSWSLPKAPVTTHLVPAPQLSSLGLLVHQLNSAGASSLTASAPPRCSNSGLNTTAKGNGGEKSHAMWVPKALQNRATITSRANCSTTFW